MTTEFSEEDAKSYVLADSSPGMLPDDVYEKTLGSWRASLRRQLVRNLRTESRWIAAMQDRVRTPWLDAYFVYTSSLGTHTFFMTSLPVLYFFGFHEAGSGLIFVLAMGVYCSSFIKDSICSPRPFAPPVTRLTMGSHHLEYGFPSTHSTNSVSIALYILYNVRAAFLDGSISSRTWIASCLFLAFYTFSIVGGRLYTAMHSFTDCAFGMLLGTSVWAMYMLGRSALDTWITQPGWTAPILSIAVALLMVNQHPQPVDDCPCFQDAIAFVSVVLGSFLGKWYRHHFGFDDSFFVKHMPGSDATDWSGLGIWWFYAVLKMTSGILLIFTWRLVAKSVLHMILPPIFRLLAHSFTLPHRRFYTPATDYKNVPAEKGLHPIPSVIDLPSQMEVDASGLSLVPDNPYRHLGQQLKLRNGFNNGTSKAYVVQMEQMEQSAGNDVQSDNDVVKHYDADVLTRVIVYCGICILSAEVIPITFECLGWGVHP